MRTRQRFVVRNNKGQFLTPRRSTGRMYENRSGWSKCLDDAKIFSTKGAATNSGNQSQTTGFTVLPVNIVLQDS